MRKVDWEGARADLVAYAWIAVFLVLFQLMVMYTVLDALLTKTLYGIGLAMHADMALLDRLVLIWRYLPTCILICLIIWAIATSIRQEGDTYYGGRYG